LRAINSFLPNSLEKGDPFPAAPKQNPEIGAIGNRTGVDLR
jgi:hypothetical protein